MRQMDNKRSDVRTHRRDSVREARLFGDGNNDISRCFATFEMLQKNIIVDCKMDVAVDLQDLVNLNKDGE